MQYVTAASVQSLLQLWCQGLKVMCLYCDFQLVRDHRWTFLPERQADLSLGCCCRWMTIVLFSLFLWHFYNQVWQCGGSVEVLPCARIAHIERAHKPYTDDLTSHVRRNALRVAEVWMDEFKSHVYMAWNIPLEVSDHGYHVVFWKGLTLHGRSKCDIRSQ